MTTAPSTVVGALVARARAHPDSTAYAVEEHGIWREVTYTELLAEVGQAAAALRAAGVGPGQRIALMADPSPILLAVDLAAQLVGAVPVALYPSTAPDEVARQLQLIGPSLIVAGSHEHVDLVLGDAAAAAPPRIVVVDDRGMFEYGADAVDRFSSWRVQADPLTSDEVGSLAAGIDPDAPAFLFLTAGTTRPAEAVPLSHRNIVTTWTKVFEVVGEPTSRDRVLVDFPLAHLAGRVVGSYAPLLYGCVPHHAGSVESIATARTQVVPTIALGTPRSWGRVVSQVTVGAVTTTRVKRAFIRAALRTRRRALEGVTWLRPLAGLLQHIAVRPALEKLGCSGLRIALVVGGPTPRRVEDEWRLLGVELREVYGTVETSGAAIVQPAGAPAGSAGRPLPGTEVELGEGGAILVRGSNVCSELAGREGWLATGDVGAAAEPGGLRVVDRQLSRLGGPAGCYPAELEQELISSPYVGEAVVLERSTAGLGVLVELEVEAVSEWARAQRVAYTSVANLAVQPEVVALVEAEVDAANERLAAQQRPRIEAIRILPGELDPAAGELTPTRNVRRTTVASRYGALFDERSPSHGL